MQRYWFGPVNSTCGFPEGDAHSVLVMLSIALLWASNVQTAATAAYADNWSWHTGNEHDHGPAAKATTDVTECCCLDIDWKKTWRWASDSETAHKAWESIRSEMPIHEIERCHNAKDLGFQLHCSGVRELGSRKARYDNGMKRLLPLSMISHDLSTKEHILRSSVYPAMFYGTEIFRVATEIFRVAIDSLAKVRSAAAEALVGQSHSMSPALVLFLTNGGILDPEFAVLSQALRTAVQWISHQTDAKQKGVF